MKPTLLKSLAVGATLMLFQSAYATLMFEEGFNYASGPLGSPWTVGGGVGTALTVGSANITYPGLADAAAPGNDLVNANTPVGAMYINFNTAAVTSGSVYFSFIAEATAMPTANNFLFSLLPSGATSGAGNGDPLSVYAGSVSGNAAYRLGVRHSTGSSGATYISNPSLFTANTVNFFVAKYTFGGNGRVDLYANPTPGGAEPGTPGASQTLGADAANLQVLALKANNGAGGAWIFDTLRIGDTWADVTPAVPEPSTFVLAGLGLLALASLRRR